MLTRRALVGLPVSMLLGHLVLKKNYSPVQVVRVLLLHTVIILSPEKLSITIVSFGALLATLSTSPSSTVSEKRIDNQRYPIGILMLVCSLLLTGILGVLQEKTYARYGPCWREGIFYTV